MGRIERTREIARRRNRRAKLKKLRKQFAGAKSDAEKSEIKAPFPAIVGARFADEGVVIAAGAPVFDLLERTNPEVRIGLAGDAVDGERGCGRRAGTDCRSSQQPSWLPAGSIFGARSGAAFRK